MKLIVQRHDEMAGQCIDLTQCTSDLPTDPSDTECNRNELPQVQPNRRLVVHKRQFCIAVCKLDALTCSWHTGNL